LKETFQCLLLRFSGQDFLLHQRVKEGKKERKKNRKRNWTIDRMKSRKGQITKEWKKLSWQCKKKTFFLCRLLNLSPSSTKRLQIKCKQRKFEFKFDRLGRKSKRIPEKEMKKYFKLQQNFMFHLLFPWTKWSEFYGKSDVPTLIHSKVNASSCISGVPSRSKLHGIHWGLRIIFSFSIFQQFSIGTLLLQNNVFQFFNCYRNPLKLNFLCHFLPKFTRFLCLSFKNTFSEKFNFENITYQLY